MYIYLVHNGLRSGSLKHSKQREKGLTIMKWDFSFHSAYLSASFCFVCLQARLELLMMWNRSCQDVAYTHNSTFPTKWGKPPWRKRNHDERVCMLLNALLNYPLSAFDRMTKGIFLWIEMKKRGKGCHHGFSVWHSMFMLYLTTFTKKAYEKKSWKPNS